MNGYVQQMQLRFVPREDRLLFALHTSLNQEFLFWFTRRYSKGLWELLQKTIYTEAGLETETDFMRANAVFSFQHEQALAGADFNTPYQPKPQEHPLGEQPLLVSRATLRTQADGLHVLSLLPDRAKGVDITLDQRLLHVFCKLLADAVNKSDWDLHYPLPKTGPVRSSQAMN